MLLFFCPCYQRGWVSQVQAQPHKKRPVTKVWGGIPSKYSKILDASQHSEMVFPVNIQRSEMVFIGIRQHSKIWNGIPSQHAKIGDGIPSQHAKISDSIPSQHSTIWGGILSQHSKIWDGIPSKHTTNCFRLRFKYVECGIFFLSDRTGK